MALITHLNYTTTLKQSTTARGATPNGNVFFNQTTGELELIGGRDSTTPGTAPTQAASGRYAGFAGITETLPADTDDDIPF
jgi:hypothetical protein